jgi:hypothetical protein
LLAIESGSTGYIYLLAAGESFGFTFTKTASRVGSRLSTSFASRWLVLEEKGGPLTLKVKEEERLL